MTLIDDSFSERVRAILKADTIKLTFLGAYLNQGDCYEITVTRSGILSSMLFQRRVFRNLADPEAFIAKQLQWAFQQMPRDRS